MEGPAASDGGGTAPSGVGGSVSSEVHSSLTSNLLVKPVLSTTVRPRKRESVGAKSDTRTLAAISSRCPDVIQPHHSVGGSGGGLVGSGGVQLPSFDSVSLGPSLPSFLATIRA